MNYLIKRSRSLDFNLIPRESYLGRWSRETTPKDSQERYERNIQRSYTPVREIGSFKVIQDDRLPHTTYRARTPLDIITTPYHTNINYYQEQLPIRKYDVFSVRTWSYPIYKYLHSRDFAPTRPYSFTRVYGNTSTYTPPMLAAETRRLTQRRNYTGYTYIGAEHSYDIASRPYSLDHSRYSRSYLSSSPWYTSYYGNIGLRHYNSYRPRTYFTRLSTYWTPYY
ncbi:Threonylcarbamoyl-AMP synthase [Dirofilaria immitis]